MRAKYYFGHTQAQMAEHISHMNSSPDETTNRRFLTMIDSPVNSVGASVSRPISSAQTGAAPTSETANTADATSLFQSCLVAERSTYVGRQRCTGGAKAVAELTAVSKRSTDLAVVMIAMVGSGVECHDEDDLEDTSRKEGRTDRQSDKDTRGGRRRMSSGHAPTKNGQTIQNLTI
jgi:hypothetical protein